MWGSLNLGGPDEPSDSWLYRDAGKENGNYYSMIGKILGVLVPLSRWGGRPHYRLTAVRLSSFENATNHL